VTFDWIGSFSYSVALVVKVTNDESTSSPTASATATWQQTLAVGGMQCAQRWHCCNQGNTELTLDRGWMQGMAWAYLAAGVPDGLVCLGLEGECEGFNLGRGNAA